MKSSPIIDKTFGIITNEFKFREIRQKAKEEINHRKSNKNKTRTKPPLYFNKKVVLYNSRYCSSKREYYLVDVIDFDDHIGIYGNFEYFGILLKTTDRHNINRIGRLIHFYENGYSGYMYANVEDRNIKWL